MTARAMRAATLREVATIRSLQRHSAESEAAEADRGARERRAAEQNARNAFDLGQRAWEATRAEPSLDPLLLRAWATRLLSLDEEVDHAAVAVSDAETLLSAARVVLQERTLCADKADKEAGRARIAARREHEEARLAELADRRPLHGERQ